MGLSVRFRTVTAIIGQLRDGKSTGSTLSRSLPKQQDRHGKVVMHFLVAAMLARKCTDSVFIWTLGGFNPCALNASATSR